VKARVAAYKYPRHVWLVDALAKGLTGRSSSARSTCRQRSRRELHLAQGDRQGAAHRVDPFELRSGEMAIASIEDLRRHLQWAVELERGTLPPYLRALYSIEESRPTPLTHSCALSWP
jgi:hypothetical protein